jgi:hypothetical protein
MEAVIVRALRPLPVLAIFLLAAVMSCTRTVQEGRCTAGRAAVGASESLHATAGTEREDSLETIRRVLHEERLLDHGDPVIEEHFSPANENAAMQAQKDPGTPPSQTPKDRRAGRTPRGGKSGLVCSIEEILHYIRFTCLFGRRSDHKILFTHPKWLSMGFRSSENGSVSFIRATALGSVETLAIGNLRVTFGEGLLLGRRDPHLTPLCAARRKGDMRISSSLSCWEHTSGVGSSVRAGNVQFGTLIWEREKANDARRQKELWLAASLRGDGWWAGAVAGRSLHTADSPAIQSIPSRALAVSLCIQQEHAKTVSSPRRRAAVSGEVAAWDGEVFYVCAMGLRGRGTGWIRVFRQPAAGGYGGSANGLSRVDRILQGSTLRWSGRFGSAKFELSLYDGSIMGSSRSSRYRRGTVCIGERQGRARPHGWAISASLIERRKQSFVSDELEPEARRDKWVEERVGLQWDFAAGMNLSHRLRVELRFAEPGGRAGMVISSGGRFSSQWGEIMYRFTNYRLDASMCGVVSRPGVGPFEHMSFVYGCGSDVSLRMRLWLCSWFEILAYCGRPWEKPARVYFGLAYPR